MNNIYKILIALPILSLMFFSCTSEADDSISANQETYIESITSSLLSTYDEAYAVNNNGSTRVVISPGSGDSLSTTGMVAFYYAAYYLTTSSISSSNMFYTNSEDIAESVSWSVSDSTIFQVYTTKADNEELVEGLRNGLLGVKSGEECYIMFSAKYGYGKHQNGTIPANSALAYHVWVEGVQNE